MSAELIVKLRTSAFPDSARTCGHAVPASAAGRRLLLGLCWWQRCCSCFFSARYESHFKVLLRRGRYDPVVSSQPASPMDFTRPDITEEELNSEVELLRDEDLLKQVVKWPGSIPADTPGVRTSSRDRTCGSQTVAPPGCGGAEKVEPDSGQL